MYINELYDKLPLLSAETYTYISRDGDCHTESEPVLTEHILDVYLNDRLTMKLVCIPQYLTELVLGRLLTEGILEDASDVEQIYICEHRSRQPSAGRTCCFGWRRFSGALHRAYALLLHRESHFKRLFSDREAGKAGDSHFLEGRAGL